MNINPSKIFAFLSDQNEMYYPDAINVGTEFINHLIRGFLTKRPDSDITASSAVAHLITHDDFKLVIMERNAYEKFNKNDQVRTFQGYLDLIGLYIFSGLEFAERTIIFSDIMVSTIIPYYDTFSEENKLNFIVMREKEKRFALNEMRKEFLIDGRPYIKFFSNHLSRKNPDKAYCLGSKMASDTFCIFVSMIIALQNGEFSGI